MNNRDDDAGSTEIFREEVLVIRTPRGSVAIDLHQPKTDEMQPTPCVREENDQVTINRKLVLDQLDVREPNWNRKLSFNYDDLQIPTKTPTKDPPTQPEPTPFQETTGCYQIDNGWPLKSAPEPSKQSSDSNQEKKNLPMPASKKKIVKKKIVKKKPTLKVTPHTDSDCSQLKPRRKPPVKKSPAKAPATKIVKKRKEFDNEKFVTNIQKKCMSKLLKAPHNAWIHKPYTTVQVSLKPEDLSLVLGEPRKQDKRFIWWPTMDAVDLKAKLGFVESFDGNYRGKI
jgi:hypothetical protein